MIVERHASVPQPRVQEPNVHVNHVTREKYQVERRMEVRRSRAALRLFEGAGPALHRRLPHVLEWQDREQAQPPQLDLVLSRTPSQETIPVSHLPNQLSPV